MQQIANKLSNFTIVGLGENSHYVRYPTKYRLELFKKLVFQSNFNTIFFETDIFYASIVNAYIHSIIDSDPKILVENLYYMWRSQIIVDFIKWMKQYNDKADKTRKIYFLGFDSQNPFHFKKYSNNNKNIPSKIVTLSLKFYRQIFDINYTTIQKLFSYVSTGYEKKYGNTQLYDKYRELNSSKIFFLHHKHILPKNSKIFIIAHQAHLAKIKSKSFPYLPFGYYLAQKYKNNFISVAMDILSGKVACNRVLKGTKVNYNILPSQNKNIVRLIDSNYHYSNECDDSTNQYKINPLKYHDAILVFNFDTPYTSKKKQFSKYIIKILRKFITNSNFNLQLFFKKYHVDIPIKYISLINYDL